MRTKLIVGSLFAFTALSSSAALLDSVNIPQTPQQEAKIELGKMLWFDPRLSLSGKISCNSCHDLSKTVQIRSLFLLVTPEEKGQ